MQNGKKGTRGFIVREKRERECEEGKCKRARETREIVTDC